jgi:hypothetical protein
VGRAGIMCTDDVARHGHPLPEIRTLRVMWRAWKPAHAQEALLTETGSNG